jgi:FKBP-type peptidyl-prolyl cis-trans isomerase FklB
MRVITAAILMMFAGIAAAQDAAPENPAENQSYALGAELGNQLRQNSVEVDLDHFIQGLKDGLAGKVAESEIRTTVEEMKADRERKKAALQNEQRLKNQMEGQAFLADNKAKNGVVTLASGLQYKVLKAGEGRKPLLDDTVMCHYRGTLIDGKQFDNSYSRRQPATFAVNRVIKGWTEALQLMPVGSKWELFVPADLAYGERGAGSQIGPGQTLIFEVELIGIKDAPGSDASVGKVHASAASDQQTKNQAQEPAPAPAAGRPAAIQLSFKLDPRLSGGTYGGERWVSPSTFVGASAQDTIEIKAVGKNAQGKPVPIKPTWTASDAGMVAVSPAQGDAVKITVKKAGQSSLQVSSAGITRALSIKAEYKNSAIQVAIAQEP